MGSNPGSVKLFFFFFFFLLFFSLFLFLNTKKVFWVQTSPLPLPPHTFFHFLNIIQYLLVHCTIPSILGSHPPYPTSPLYPQHCVHIHPDPRPTNTPPHLTLSATDPPPPPHWTPPPPKKIFFLIFTKTSILRSHPP